MASDPELGAVIGLATAISDLTGMDIGQIEGFVVATLDGDGEVGVISTSTDLMRAIAVLATAIHKLAGEPVPDLLISDGPD